MAEKLVKTGYANNNTNWAIKLYVTYTYSQDIEKNETVITCGMYVTTGINIGEWTDHYGSYVGTTGNTFNGTIPYGTGKRTLASGKQFTVKHDDEGKATATIKWKWGVNSEWGQFENPSGSFTVTLPTIPRQATLLTAPNFTDGSNPKITYSNPAGDAVTALEACISFTGAKDDIPYRSIPKTGSSYTFNLTTAERETLRTATANSNSKNVRFYIKTTLGGTTYHDYLTRTFSVSGADPIVTASVVDVNEQTIALTGDSSKLIKYYSDAKVTMSAEAQKGAAINEDLYIVRNGDRTGYGTECTFEQVESDSFVCTAEDSRGNVGTATLAPDMVNYVRLTCNIGNDKPDAAGRMTVICTGNYYNGSFGAASNTLTVRCRANQYGGSVGSWVNMSVSISGNSYTATATLTGLNYKLAYNFEAIATDALDSASDDTGAIRSTPIFHWGENDFVFEVPVSFNAGTDTEDNGTWTPSLHSSVVSSYTTRNGWYSKVGQTVVVGFYIKATCVSGYDGLTISISGLPFTPALSAAGGGMCSGAYISGGFTFQCFVAESSGLITTRVQACNNTSASNLSTSATGCNYRSGGGDITLAGTIVFMANS